MHPRNALDQLGISRKGKIESQQVSAKATKALMAYLYECINIIETLEALPSLAHRLPQLASGTGKPDEKNSRTYKTAQSHLSSLLFHSNPLNARAHGCVNVFLILLEVGHQRSLQLPACYPRNRKQILTVQRSRRECLPKKAKTPL